VIMNYKLAIELQVIEQLFWKPQKRPYLISTLRELY